MALGLAFVFLDKLLLLDTALPVASFTWSDQVATDAPRAMIIDAQAIEHLDILPPVSKKAADCSLFSTLSQSISTAFGKRMLKRWVVAPLTNTDQIRERQDAVGDLVKHEKLRELI